MRFSGRSPDWMRIRTGPDFQIWCILDGKWQIPDCAVCIALEGLWYRRCKTCSSLFSVLSKPNYLCSYNFVHSWPLPAAIATYLCSFCFPDDTNTCALRRAQHPLAHAPVVESKFLWIRDDCSSLANDFYQCLRSTSCRRCILSGHRQTFPTDMLCAWLWHRVVNCFQTQHSSATTTHLFLTA